MFATIFYYDLVMKGILQDQWNLENELLYFFALKKQLCLNYYWCKKNSMKLWWLIKNNHDSSRRFCWKFQWPLITYNKRINTSWLKIFVGQTNLQNKNRCIYLCRSLLCYKEWFWLDHYTNANYHFDLTLYFSGAFTRSVIKRGLLPRGILQYSLIM